MKNFILKTSKPILLFFLFFTSFAIAQPTTHIVNNNAGTSADFDNLQAAIDAAANGDIIHVQQSATSYGNITLDKELTLIGRSHGDASYTSEIGTLDLAAGCSNSTIKGFEISTISDPFVSGGATHTIEDLVIQDNRIQTLQNIGLYGTFNNVLIQGNYITSTITIREKTSNFLITNNVISGSSLSFYLADTLLFSNNILSYYIGTSITNNTPDLLNISNCIFVIDYFQNRNINLSSSSGTIQVNNCITYNYNAGGNCNFSTGTNITVTNSQENADPLFTNRNGASSSGTIADPSGTQIVAGIDDLTLQASSPVSDDGLYENYNFKPLGTPSGLPSLKIDSYNPTVAKNSDLTVTISAKTN